MHKYLIITIILTGNCLLSTFDCFGQAPGIRWQKSFGGSGFDYLAASNLTADGGFILGGYSSSIISGNKTEANIGGSDFWIIKLNSTGDIEWQNVIGGSTSDKLATIEQTPDGGYIVGGTSQSTVSGDKTEPSMGNDFWILKLDNFGNIIWQNTIGGSATENLYSILQTDDGGYLLGGSSLSGISGDKTETNRGSLDYWVVKINSIGNILWQKTFGGSSSEEIYTMCKTPDGGYLLGGHSFSGISGDKTQPNSGYSDYWIIKIDNSGTLVWQDDIGGSSSDYLYQMILCTDNTFILSGASGSPISGDKTDASNGNFDYWIIKISNTDSIIWQNSIGGSEIDICNSVEELSTGGYLLGGTSTSNNTGDKTSANFLTDYWLVNITNDGNVVWDKAFLANNVEYLGLVKEVAPEKYFVAGYSGSAISYDKTATYYGLYDYWVMMLDTCSIELCNNLDDDCDGLFDDYDPDVIGQTNFYADFDNDTYGNPIQDTLSCFLPTGYTINSLDCDDTNFIVNPDGIEITDGIDENCDGIIDNLSTYFLKGKYIEMGINSCGVYGTADSPPMGYHPNFIIPGEQLISVIADSDKDGWEIGTPNYCGDYFLPGLALEGFSIQINDTFYVNSKYFCNTNMIEGNYAGYNKTPELTTALWNGSIPEENLQLKQKTILGDTDLFFITEITLINNNPFDLNDVYYLRTVDPDQEQILTGNFSTYNEIISNPPTDYDALIKAEGNSYGCYLAIGARNNSARVSFKSSLNIENLKPSDAWQGLSGNFLTGFVNSDYQITITFKIPNIPSGDSVKLSIAYIFSADETENALEATNLCFPTVELCNTLDDNCNGLIDDGVIETISISAGGPTTFCQGGSVVLSAIYSGATVQWKKDGVNIAGATTANYTVTKKGNYTCVTTSPCGTATSSIINVVVNKNPNASISAGGATTFCAGGSVTLTEIASPGCTYQWYKGASAIAGATSTNYIATTTGNYKCRVTKTATGCYKNSNAISVSVPCRESELSMVSGESGFTLYPNPANDKLNIQIETQFLSTFSFLLTITDLQGREIYTTNLNSLTTEINISDFASGMYFVKVNFDGEEMIEKFIKN